MNLMTQRSSLPWWRTDTYDGELALPDAFTHWAGPNGLGLVRAWPDGTTDPGWGLDSPSTGKGFMERYNEDEFSSRQIYYSNGFPLQFFHHQRARAAKLHIVGMHRYGEYLYFFHAVN